MFRFLKRIPKNKSLAGPRCGRVRRCRGIGVPGVEEMLSYTGLGFRVR